MTERTTAERLTALEIHQEHQTETNDELLVEIKRIGGEVKTISDWMQNKTGFIAGVVFCGSIIAACIGAFASSIWTAVTGK